jgi:hypothetical protein
MSEIGTFSTKTFKRKASVIEQTTPKDVNKLKQWYNRKLQELLDLSEDYEQGHKQDEEDWAKLIHNEQFGILYTFIHTDEFSMVRKRSLNGSKPEYTVTRFGLYTENNKENGDQRYIISDRVRCQCTFLERNWFENPYNSWYIIEQKILVIPDFVKVLAEKEFEKDLDGEYRDHYKNYLFIKDLCVFDPEKYNKHLRALNFTPTAYNIDYTLWFD